MFVYVLYMVHLCKGLTNVCGLFHSGLETNLTRVLAVHKVPYHLQIGRFIMSLLIGNGAVLKSSSQWQLKEF